MLRWAIGSAANFLRGGEINFMAAPRRMPDVLSLRRKDTGNSVLVKEEDA
jgi:hypothetical protein